MYILSFCQKARAGYGCLHLRWYLRGHQFELWKARAFNCLYSTGIMGRHSESCAHRVLRQMIGWITIILSKYIGRVMMWTASVRNNLVISHSQYIGTFIACITVQAQTCAINLGLPLRSEFLQGTYYIILSLLWFFYFFYCHLYIYH